MRLIPLIPLDSPQLTGGPYTDEQFQSGQVAIRDLGLLYGYVYRPMRFTGDPDGVMGTSVWHRHGDMAERFPWYKTREEAVDFLRKHGYYGHVQRYCLDPGIIRGEYEDVVLCAGIAPVRRQREPWVTAGVTDVVNAKSPTEYHGHLVGEMQPVIHVRDDLSSS